MLGIIDTGDVNEAVRAAKLRDKRLRYDVVLAYFLLTDREANVAKKSKKSKRSAPARKKKGMKKAKPAKRAKAKKRAPKPIPAPVAPSQSAPAPPLGGKEMAL
jgi:hypothetical protein